jgi:hypothetical protein
LEKLALPTAARHSKAPMPGESRSRSRRCLTHLIGPSEGSARFARFFRFDVALRPAQLAFRLRSVFFAFPLLAATAATILFLLLVLFLLGEEEEEEKQLRTLPPPVFDSTTETAAAKRMAAEERPLGCRYCPSGQFAFGRPRFLPSAAASAAEERPSGWRPRGATSAAGSVPWASTLLAGQFASAGARGRPSAILINLFALGKKGRRKEWRVPHTHMDKTIMEDSGPI